MSGPYRCVTCDQVWPDGVPDDAIEITQGKTATWKFTNGELHHIRKIKIKKLAATPQEIKHDAV